jgi:tRNA A-37 threonylcarbamoyl transferase component Bud32
MRPVGATVQARFACIGESTLAAFAEGAAGPHAERSIEEHLADCPDCRAVLACAVGVVQPPPDRSSASSGPGEEEEGLLSGTRVGRYVVEELVGRGAMGAVYAAHDPDLDRKVAVKLLRAGSLSEAARQRVRARLLREAKAMARLSHPEVITVYDVGAFGDQLFVAMEYVDGGTLRHWRAVQHRSYADIMAVYERAGSGLAAAHEAGLVHRDFKPDNVLIGRDGRVRVMDFGLARSAERGDVAAEPISGEMAVTESRALSSTLTRTGTLLGTPAYMAPEQLRGGTANARSDVFSFCVALYEALYGERPFAGANVVGLQKAIEQGQVRAPPMITRVPAWVHALLLRGLRAPPEERFASMRGLLDALRASHVRSRSRRRAVRVFAGTMLAALGMVAAASAYTRPAPAVARHEAVGERSPGIASRAVPARDSEHPMDPPAAIQTADFFGVAPVQAPTRVRSGSVKPSPPIASSADSRSAAARGPVRSSAPPTVVPLVGSSTPPTVVQLVGNNGAFILE